MLFMFKTNQNSVKKVLKKRILINGFLLIVCISLFIGFTSSDVQLDHFIDLPGLKKSGEDWNVLFQDINPEKGHIKLHHDKWLMYFLHWRPLTEENKNISIEYVRKLMLSFWGPNMPFTIKGNGGETEIYGHKAYFIDGTIYNGAIHSRFIVWNCPKTDRQFISDCNINLRLGTPGYLLETQKHITQTIRCHEGFSKAMPDKFPRTYESEKWNLSFNIPENWKTAEYIDKKWFPNGMSNQNGSLWTLLTDSRKYLELLWEETDVPLNADLFKSFLERITKPFTHEDITLQVTQVKLESVKVKNGYYMGEGSHQFKQVVKDKEYKSDYTFKGLLWKKEKRIYFLFASLIGLKEFWGIKNDLSPTDETLEKYLHLEILPNIKELDKNFLK